MLYKDNSIFTNFQKSCFLLCYHVFIVLVSCFFKLFFNLVKITQLQYEINWKAQWKNMINE